MNKTQLIKRWKTEEGKKLLQSIICSLQEGRSLDVLKIAKYNGRWDLRGAELSVLKKEKKIETSGHSFSQKLGSLKLKKVYLQSIDFSYSNISYAWIEKCIISNCIFKETKAKELHIIATEFSNTIFEKADLSYSFLNENVGSDSGIYRNTTFTETNLKECSFCFPFIEDCLFDNCLLYATNFNGSRFSRSKFIGEVNGPIFSGYPQRINKSLFGIFNRVNEKDFFNKMNNVDFYEAQMIGVSFINGIDLNKCVFPNSENYIIVKDIHTTFSKVKETVNKDWSLEERRIANNLIDNLYLSENRLHQKMDLIDKFSLIDNGKMQEFGEKFFNLIKTMA